MRLAKHVNLRILSYGILIALVIAGCGPQGNKAGSSVYSWSAGTTQEGSVAYVAIGAMAEVINRNTETVQMTPTPLSGSTAGLKAYAAGDVDSMYASLQQMDQYINGWGPFDPTVFEVTRPVSFFTPCWELSYFAVVRAEDAENLNGWSDFVGKRVYPLTKTSSTYEVCQTVLGPDGLDIWDELDIKLFDLSQAADAFQVKEVDVLIGYATAGIPVAWVEEVMTRCDVKIIVPTPEEVEKMVAAAPYFSTSQISSKGFSKDVGLPETFGTFSLGFIDVVDPEMDEEIVYQAKKALRENAKDMAMITQLLEPYASDPLGYTKKMVESAQKLGLEVHPGVKRYCAEQGYEF